MKIFLRLVLPLVLLMPCAGQSAFNFYVEDTTDTEKLKYKYIQTITIYDWDSNDPSLNCQNEYWVDGINQDSFSFTKESFSVSLARRDYEKFLKETRELPLKELGEAKEDKGTFGYGNIGEDDYQIRAGPETEARKKWGVFLDRFMAEHVPADKRKKKTMTLEGERVKPVDVDFPTLLKNPGEYDGKRIRITGYYHSEFEGSCFAETKELIRDGKKSIWLNGASRFADLEKVKQLTDIVITVEGTFEFGPGGHMGGWMGEISRLTSCQLAPRTPGGAKGLVRGEWYRYQSTEEEEKRIVSSGEETMAYVKQIESVCDEFFADATTPETLKIVFAVRPGKMSKFWFISSTVPDGSKEREVLRERLEKIPPFAVAEGPVGYALGMTVAGGDGTAFPLLYEATTPLPKEWIAVWDQEKDGEFKLDRELEKVWPK